MSRHRPTLRTPPAPGVIVTNHALVELAVASFHSPRHPDYGSHFAFHTRDEVDSLREAALDEHASQSSLALLAAIEAAFRVDYVLRHRLRPRDGLSREMRKLFAEKGRYARLADDILRVWRDYSTAPRGLLGEVAGAFNYRHWLAHGRYYPPKFGRAYDFSTIRDLAAAVERAFPFLSLSA
ncbi:MAG: hypothetical protein F4089_13610 [Gammaproteobacteria bacterium]|nr:hypothetical protein [Gammaproteobacteria bacterium]MYJ76059.1 hypothetical protein [Gammaproteobacteria bacterium]